jgi:hypothetical protein
MKSMDFELGEGANHSDTSWYREDLQRSHGLKDTISWPVICGTPHWHPMDKKKGSRNCLFRV